MQLNENIRLLRKTRFLSQRDLAEKACVNMATICRIENGRHEPQPGTVRRIAQALGVRPEELWLEQVRLLR